MGYDATEVGQMLGVCARVAIRLMRQFRERGGHVIDLGALLPTPPQRAKKFMPRLPVASWHQMLAQMAGTTVPGHHAGRQIQQRNRQQRERSPQQRQRDREKLQALRQGKLEVAV